MNARTIYLLSLVLVLGAIPVLADGTWEGRISDGNDDIEEHVGAGNMDITSSDIEMPYEDDGAVDPQIVGLRFQGVTVPKGSAIKNAYIVFVCDELRDASLPVSLLIEGELSPNAAAFATTANNLSDRTPTTAQAIWVPVNWTAEGQVDQTSNIGPVIEEIVNQAGWSSGNTLVLMIRDDPDNPSQGHRGAEAYNGDAAAAALLHIEWGAQTKATGSVPAEGETDVVRDDDLSWTSGLFAATHDVYLGTEFDAVDAASRANPRDVLVSQGQTAASYDPGRLEFGQTYYWRVDEVNGAPDNTIFKGDVWNFTVEPFVYPVENVVATAFASDPGSDVENIVNGSGLNENDEHSTESTDMWSGTLTGADPVWVQFEFDAVYKLYEMLVWNYNVQFEAILGFGLNEVTVEYSENGTDWTALGDLVIAKATSSADYAANTVIDFAGMPVKFVKLTANSNHGMLPQYGLSEVRFMHIPVNARNPVPAAGATEVAVDAVLGWRAGREADAHTVYVSADEQAVIDGTAPADTVATNSLAPANLEFGADYYWRVDEVNEAEAIGLWSGSVWSFMTQEYALIDGFESYDDDENRIYDTWLDGWVNNTNSTVGYLESPFAEKTIVNSGSQSMPMGYDNSVAPMYSEAEYDLGGMDLDTNGADTLRLFVSGLAPAFYEGADGTIAMSAIGDDIWGTADQFRYVYRQLTGDGSIVARVDALDGAPSTWAKGGVMIRQSTEAGAINTFMAMTGGDGAGSTYQQRMEADTDSVSQHTYDDGPFAPPYWVRVTREGNTLLGYTSPDGETWTQRGDTVTLAMADPVLIGLALTSHNTAAATGAAFSNVSLTGNVTGSWEVGEIGVAQPTGGNAIEPLYVALEDTNGSMAVVSHPNPAAVGISAWQEWLIPYADLGGINLNSVQTIYVGVGDRDNPASGGAGTVFIDDVGYGRAVAGE